MGKSSGRYFILCEKNNINIIYRFYDKHSKCPVSISISYFVLLQPDQSQYTISIYVQSAT
ncbi:hypothetical protein DERF_008700 [Dermatophagoides farinae]|uniref:Uncharacterized protein n=1 Tax=Dermatophagoides farinae TaxID=6954 RepID=A0A922I1H2_DERFA|nr:hypothetical protein DERF_008700 [Dermatophagoides farinae]